MESEFVFITGTNQNLTQNTFQKTTAELKLDAEPIQLPGANRLCAMFKPENSETFSSFKTEIESSKETLTFDFLIQQQPERMSRPNWLCLRSTEPCEFSCGHTDYSTEHSKITFRARYKYPHTRARACTHPHIIHLKLMHARTYYTLKLFELLDNNAHQLSLCKIQHCRAHMMRCLHRHARIKWFRLQYIV